MVFLSRFPLCLAHTPSAADAAQRKNTARLTCQELSAAFYQLLCIPPLSPPATSDELPNNRTFQQWGFQLCSKPGPCRAFAEASSALGQDAAGATFSVALGTRLAALCLLEQPLLPEWDWVSLFVCNSWLWNHFEEGARQEDSAKTALIRLKTHHWFVMGSSKDLGC